ncbi:uncharacterized protein BCR38DRAFT_413144 [Pseudomassariella vexata]|uniref:MARVEL domain-containing protein n=1 Tax=Pseudomassariella vexata TaxID=1141098 RepID=A0A1Y2DHW3_9PEZI|nr:uncharacterized protein BCR38DRAFT_413144 [Pseudomassariella vexata]ORY58828.1 hypothetical protein BCR38DRAFT_413144 [Pseudomassariella vexata]
MRKMLSTAAIAVRLFQLLLAVVVLGLWVTLTKAQINARCPPRQALAALWTESIQSFVVLTADGVSAVLYLVGDIVLPHVMKSVSSCVATDDKAKPDRLGKKIINIGCWDGDFNHQTPQNCAAIPMDLLRPACQRTQANYVFGFSGFIFAVGMFFLRHMLSHRGRTARTTQG